MSTHEELRARAEATGILTFGDALRALGVHGQDVWSGDYTTDMDSEYLYDCAAANHLLESLASAGCI